MMATLEVADTEVSNAFQAARNGGLQSVLGAGALQLQANADRSDDEESDHTPDPYTSHMKGRVSPSPYTANTERARMFNSYVRSVIEQKLDVLVPISHQPRDLITDIIADASGKFPEFSSCVRKRIRTFLKSYRRSRKLKDGSIPTTNGIGSKADDSEHSPTPEHTPPSSSPNRAVVTIITDTPQSNEEDILPPEPKKVRLQSPTSVQVPGSNPMIVHAGLMAAAAAAASNNTSTIHTQRLSPQEVQAIKQLITGYRESAAFLERAADQLGTMLRKDAAAAASSS